MIHVVVVFYNDSFFESDAKKTSLTKQLKKFALIYCKNFPSFSMVLQCFVFVFVTAYVTYDLLFVISSNKTKNKTKTK